MPRAQVSQDNLFSKFYNNQLLQAASLTINSTYVYTANLFSSDALQTLNIPANFSQEFWPLGAEAYLIPTGTAGVDVAPAANVTLNGGTATVSLGTTAYGGIFVLHRVGVNEWLLLKGIAAGGVSDTNKVLVSATDTTADYLGVKIAQGYSIIFDILNPGADESVQIAFDPTVFVADFIDTVHSFTANQAVAQVALVDAANIAVDAAASNNFTVTIAGNRTLDNPTNLTAGMVLNFEIIQGVGGSHTLAYGNLYKFPGGVAPTASTGAGQVDFMSCYYDGTQLLCNFNNAYS